MSQSPSLTRLAISMILNETYDEFDWAEHPVRDYPIVHTCRIKHIDIQGMILADTKATCPICNRVYYVARYDAREEFGCQWVLHGLKTVMRPDRTVHTVEHTIFDEIGIFGDAL